MKELKNAVVIIGKISSGKSTVASHLSMEFEWPIASFGGFLKQRAIVLGINITRKNLQDLGAQYIENDTESFLSDVIEFSKNATNSLIFEGVRHLEIFHLIGNKFDNVVSFYLDVESQERYRRYIIRNDTEDRVSTYGEFLRKNEHKVECEVESLMTECTKIINANPELNLWIDGIKLLIRQSIVS